MKKIVLIILEVWNMNQKRFSDDIDIKIKDCLKNMTEEISINENMFNKIQGGIAMKKTTRRFTLKTALIAAAICITATATCIAAVKGGMWFGSSSLLNESYEMPNESVLNNKVGFVPKYVDYFECGFKFESFNFSHETYKIERLTSQLKSIKIIMLKLLTSQLF